jgi:hypothetical protein
MEYQQEQENLRREKRRKEGMAAIPARGTLEQHFKGLGNTYRYIVSSKHMK